LQHSYRNEAIATELLQGIFLKTAFAMQLLESNYRNATIETQLLQGTI
jgi:hypothetical protein